jgi:hypothetical protein
MDGASCALAQIVRAVGKLRTQDRSPTPRVVQGKPPHPDAGSDRSEDHRGACPQETEGAGAAPMAASQDAGRLAGHLGLLGGEPLPAGREGAGAGDRVARVRSAGIGPARPTAVLHVLLVGYL